MDHTDLVDRIESVLAEAAGSPDRDIAELIVDILVPVKEPPTGSVVLANGPRGTAYQRYHSDGLWHCASGHFCAWDVLLAQSNEPLIVVHVPPQG